jgi:hypothetical protein
VRASRARRRRGLAAAAVPQPHLTRAFGNAHPHQLSLRGLPQRPTHDSQSCHIDRLFAALPDYRPRAGTGFVVPRLRIKAAADLQLRGSGTKHLGF